MGKIYVICFLDEGRNGKTNLPGPSLLELVKRFKVEFDVVEISALGNRVKDIKIHIYCWSLRERANL